MQILLIALLIIVANGAPLFATNVFGSHLEGRIDGGRKLKDGQPLFGATKTWRGLLASFLITPLSSWMMGWGWNVGLVVAAAAMAGDLISSFSKRRMGLTSSARALGLDQLPESILPVVLLYWVYGFSPWVLSLAVVIFMLVSVGLSPILFRWGLRRVPH